VPWFLYTVLLFAPYLEQTPEEEAAEQLSKVRRIYIAVLTGGDAALQIRDLLMTSLHNSKQFIITEDEDKADATLKGAGDDDVFTDTFQSSEGINAHTQISSGSSASTRNYSSSSSNRSGGLSIGENESRRDEQRKHEAIATVRLVSKDGDVIWSATAESLGAKFLGASADVADKIAKRLVTDYKAAKDKVADQTTTITTVGAPSSK
jgi:altronate dehydratase